MRGSDAMRVWRLVGGSEGQRGTSSTLPHCPPGRKAPIYSDIINHLSHPRTERVNLDLASLSVVHLTIRYGDKLSTFHGNPRNPSRKHAVLSYHLSTELTF
jgi:hypothetical protein